jgi:hypothetical protein
MRVDATIIRDCQAHGAYTASRCPLCPSIKPPEPASAEPTLANAGVLQPDGSPTPAKQPNRRKSPNKTEQRMAELLEEQRKTGAIMRFEFEGISLRWGGTSDAPPMVYTPDFVCILPNGKLRFIEVKGAHVWDRDIVRFKGCRAAWPFEFQMWQWKGNEWRQLH